MIGGNSPPVSGRFSTIPSLATLLSPVLLSPLAFLPTLGSPLSPLPIVSLPIRLFPAFPSFLTGLLSLDTLLSLAPLRSSLQASPPAFRPTLDSPLSPVLLASLASPASLETLNTVFLRSFFHPSKLDLHDEADTTRTAAGASETPELLPILRGGTHSGGTHAMTRHPISLPDPALPLASQDPLVLFAMVLFGEARGSTDTARRAVAQVILNRARHPHPVFGSRSGASFDENLRAVILHPLQFSSLNSSDPNFQKLTRPLQHESPQTWERCLRCAETAIAERGQPDRLTSNADHYFDNSILPPNWASSARQTMTIGRLNFYRLYLPPPDESEASSPGPRGVPPTPRREAPAPPQDSAPGRKSGSRLAARVSRASRARVAPAPEPQSLRPSVSLPAPKSSCALICGPRPSRHRRDDWSRGLSLLAMLGFLLATVACTDAEQAAYRTLAVTQAEYELTQQKVAEAAVHGLITEDQWNRFQAEGHRFIAVHNSTVDAFQLWSQSKSKQDTARIQALLEILPRLIRDLNTLVATFQFEGTANREQEPENPPGDPLPSRDLNPSRALRPIVRGYALRSKARTFGRRAGRRGDRQGAVPEEPANPPRPSGPDGPSGPSRDREGAVIDGTAIIQLGPGPTTLEPKGISDRPTLSSLTTALHAAVILIPLCGRRTCFFFQLRKPELTLTHPPEGNAANSHRFQLPQTGINNSASPKGITVNSRRFQPTEPAHANEDQPRKGLTVRFRPPRGCHPDPALREKDLLFFQLRNPESGILSSNF